MSNSGLTVASLIAELKKRRVFRTLLYYIAIAWLIIQAVDIIGPALFLPAWSTTLVIVLLVLGMPFAVLLAWRFDIIGGEATRQASPEGTAAAYIWLAFSVVTLMGGSWLAYYSYTETIGPNVKVHSSYGVYSPPDHSIAVLPFVNLSGNPDTEYFADGLADTVLHRLAQVDELFVIARTSSFRFKGSKESIESIGRKLNAGTVLEGSIQQVGHKMRIIAQLIDARTGKHIKSLTYDATNEDIFAVQDEISLQVAEALEIELLQSVTDKLTASGTDIPKAHDLYLLGRYHAAKYTSEGVRQGHEFFKQALALDPTFVLAYVGVADTLMRSPKFEQVPGTLLQSALNEFSQQAFPDMTDAARYTQAKEALRTALVLDDQSADAFAMLGYFETWLGDKSVAESAFKKAIALRPGLANSHYVYGRYLAEERRYADAREQLRIAMELDPANIPILQWNVIFMRKDFESLLAAMALHDRIVELDPLNEFSKFRNPTILFGGWISATAVGQYFDGVVWLEKELALNPDIPVNILAIGYTYSLLGDLETAERWRALAAASPNLYGAHGAELYNWFILMRQGRTDEALAFLDALFGESESGHPVGLFYRAWIEATAGRATEAVAYYEQIPQPVRDAILFWDEAVISQVPAPAIDYAAALMQTGDERRAEEYLRRSEEFVLRFRRQGYSTAVLDWMDARIHLIRGEREQVLESLARTAGRLHFYPLEWDWMLQSLTDDPEFQRIVSLDDQNKAEQLRLLREHHKDPPPWSPDYQNTN